MSAQSSGSRLLNCYCDNCPDNTCVISLGTGMCFARVEIHPKGETDITKQILKKSYNCFSPVTSSRGSKVESPHSGVESGFGLFPRLICDTLGGSDIMKCCSDQPFCNRNSTLLPSDDEAWRTLRRVPMPAPRLPESRLPESAEPYSPPELKLVTTEPNSFLEASLELKFMFLIFTGLLLILSAALAQNMFCRSRRSRRRAAPTYKHQPQQSNLEELNQSHQNSPLVEANTSQIAGSLHSSLLTSSQTTAIGKPPVKITVRNFGLDPCKNCLPHVPESSTGSGVGRAYLTQRSIADDIQIHEAVGRGHFGVVWRGDYKGVPVAVKIFSPMAEASWQRECEIYQTTMLRHKNILGFIASDMNDEAGVIGYLLVTDYYPLGSLFDFLSANSTTMSDTVRMAFSIANGLAHLHLEIFGTFGKPAVAHRDLKSRNILVKNDGTCCIADLGMAVRYSSTTNMIDVPTNARAGTRRYLAPELLDSKINLMDFEAIKATDIYAMGLILWELLRRACLVDPNNPSDVSAFYTQNSPKTKNSAVPMVSSIKPIDTQSGTTSKLGADPVSLRSKIRQLEVSSTTPFLEPHVESSPIQPMGSHPEEDSSKDEYEIVSSTEDQASEKECKDKSQSSSLAARELEIISSPSKKTDDQSMDSLFQLATMCELFELPYHGYVSADPTTEEMRKVVCEQKMRPPLSYRWTKFAPMKDFVGVMVECWYEKPQARLSALRIRKSLSDIARQYFNLNMEYD